MAFDAHPLLAISTVVVAPSTPTAGTSLTVASGEGTWFGVVFPFQAVVCSPAGLPTRANAEVITISARPGAADTLTIVRAQEGSTARAITVGDLIYAAETPKTYTDIETRCVPTGAEVGWSAKTAPTGWLIEDGSAVSRTTYADLYAFLCPSATVTTPVASPGVVNDTAHGFIAGDPVFFEVSPGSGLPTGLTANTLYYVALTSLTTDSYKLSTTQAGAQAGTGLINFTGTDTGNHTRRYCPHGLGDGSTTFNVPTQGDRVLIGASATKPIGWLYAGDVHHHGAGSYVIPSHTHDSGTLTAPDHTHNMNSHVHGLNGHTHGLSDPSAWAMIGFTAAGIFTNRYSGFQQSSAQKATPTLTVTNNATVYTPAQVLGFTDGNSSATSAPIQTNTLGASVTLSVTGATGGTPSATGVTGTSGDTTAPLPPARALNMIIKT